MSYRKITVDGKEYKYVQENGLIGIDSINNMPTFKAADYHEIPCEAE